MRPGGIVLVGLTLILLAMSDVASSAVSDTTRVSIRSNGDEGNGSSSSSIRAISDDGRYVTLSSDASNLVGGDTNGVRDVFVHDRNTGTTTRVSVRSNGAEANGDSSSGSISADGRYVTFHSDASNLVGGDTNGIRDVFVHDRDTGATTRVSVRSNGVQANGESEFAVISGDGRYVSFYSDASNLVTGDTNGAYDTFVHDRNTGNTTRVSVRSNGTEGNADSFGQGISADGRYVTFRSVATNLVAGDTNGFSDVFVHDRNTGTTARVSLRSNGAEGNGDSFLGSISADGRHVTFRSEATNLVTGDTNGADDAFVHDRNTGITTRVSVRSNGAEGSDRSAPGAISGNGRYVTFHSDATNLVSGDTNGVTDVFVHDRNTGSTTRVSLRSNGNEGDGVSLFPAISVDGRHVAFGSSGTNLVAGDSNGFSDVFVHQFLPDPPVDWFVDDDGHTFEGDINAIASSGITRGCNPPVNDRFCPDDIVTRGQMAAFLTRALDLSVPDENPFVDTVGSTFERDIQALAAAGITRGCNPPVNDRFCPEDDVTRGQMAAFLNRGLVE